MTQIVGIVLIKDEDLHIEWVINNIVDFCDHIMILDNHSTDHTWEIVERLAGQTDKIALRKWDNAADSQKVLNRYYGTDTWVFVVDGDEIFDPSGLAVMRKRIFNGEFDNVWNVRGNHLHCVNINPELKTAEGYPAPPARDVGRLYNFKLVKGWKNEKIERLHGTPIFSQAPVIRALFLGNMWSWEESQLRCLHFCFLKRSSKDFKPQSLIKRLMHTILQRLSKQYRLNCRPAPPGKSARLKIKKYTVGDVVTKDISDFIIHDNTVHHESIVTQATALPLPIMAGRGEARKR